MRSFIKPFALGVAALGLLALTVSTADAQGFRTFGSGGFRGAPNAPAPSMTFYRPSIAIAARQYSRQNLGYTYNPYLPPPSYLRANGYLPPSQAAALAYAYSPYAYALAASYNPYANSYNPYAMSGYGGYNPSLSATGYSGGFGTGYGGAGYGRAGYGGTDSQNPYLATSPQNPYQASGSPQASAPEENTTPTVNINVYDGSYQPKSITISAGTTVRWKNVGSHMHTVTSDTGLWDSRELDPGRTVSVVFAKPGTYTYHCTLHPQKMRGTIIVE